MRAGQIRHGGEPGTAGRGEAEQHGDSHNRARRGPLAPHRYGQREGVGGLVHEDGHGQRLLDSSGLDGAERQSFQNRMQPQHSAQHVRGGSGTAMGVVAVNFRMGVMSPSVQPSQRQNEASAHETGFSPAEVTDRLGNQLEESGSQEGAARKGSPQTEPGGFRPFSL